MTGVSDAKNKKKASEAEWWRLFGLRVSYLRNRYCATQETVAKAMNISRCQLSQIENGNRRCSTLELTGLARALNISVAETIGSELLGFKINRRDME